MLVDAAEFPMMVATPNLAIRAHRFCASRLMVQEAALVSETLRDRWKAASRRWISTAYYDQVEGRTRRQWQDLLDPFMRDFEIDYSNVVDLAAGHGRNAEVLLHRAKRLTLADILPENIAFCRERFKDQTSIDYLVCNGSDLQPIPDGTVSFIFCFDSMVHFDSDIVRAYLADFRRVLKPGAYAFCHHSNFDQAPTTDFQKAPHARNFMTAELFHHYAFKEGLELVKNQVIDWGTGERFFRELDCLSLVRQPV